MIDEMINSSFELDYDIYYLLNHRLKSFTKELEQAPRINSDDIFRDFENFYKVVKENMNGCLNILNQCEEQRKTFRMLLIKMSKDKILIDKFFKEDDNTLILNKLFIHDELKSKVIDRYIDKIKEKEKKLTEIADDLERYKLIGNKNNSMHSVNISQILNTNNSSNIILPTNDTSMNPSIKRAKINQKNNKTMISRDASINEFNEDSVIKKMFNLDNSDKFNNPGIISNSPIQTPGSRKGVQYSTSRNNKSNFKNSNVHANANVTQGELYNKKNVKNNSIAKINKSDIENDFFNLIPSVSSPVEKKDNIRIKRYSKSIDFDNYESFQDNFISERDREKIIDIVIKKNNKKTYLQTEIDNEDNYSTRTNQAYINRKNNLSSSELNLNSLASMNTNITSLSSINSSKNSKPHKNQFSSNINNTKNNNVYKKSNLKSITGFNKDNATGINSLKNSIQFTDKPSTKSKQLITASERSSGVTSNSKIKSKIFN